MGAFNIPDEYFFDFLRGHLDGDGTIRVYQDPDYPNSQRLYLEFLSGSITHVHWLQHRVMELSSVDGFISRRTGATALVFAKRDSLLLLRLMYRSPDVPCLW